MKAQVFIVLILVAAAAAAPTSQSSIDVNNSTTVEPTVDCQPGSASDFNGLLTQVGNLVMNIFANFGKIVTAGLIGGTDDFMDLQNLFEQLNVLLNNLLNNLGLSDKEMVANSNLLSSVIDQIVILLDNLLGPGTGEQYVCTITDSADDLYQNLRLSATGLLTAMLGSDLGSLGSMVAQPLSALNPPLNVNV